MRLTIRRKLFLAFLGVVAVPVVMLGSLSRSYIKTARGELDRRFVEEATGSVRRLHEDMYGGIGPIQEAARRLAFAKAIRDPTSGQPIEPLVRQFLREHPEAIGVRIEGRIAAPAGEPTEGLVEQLRNALELMGEDKPKGL